MVLIHNDIDVPFSKEGSAPAYLDQMTAVLKRTPTRLSSGHILAWAAWFDQSRITPQISRRYYGGADFHHVYFDISWDEVAKYVVSNPAAVKIMADLMERHPDRFLFGTDEVAPTTESNYLRVFKQYATLWKLLTPSTSERVRKMNYERIFDEARHRVRTWESSRKEAVRVH